MSWWHPNMVWITHLPTGHRVAVEGWRSFYKARDRAWHMLRGKLYAEQIGDGPKQHIIRDYVLESRPQDDNGLAQMREFDGKYKPGR